MPASLCSSSSSYTPELLRSDTRSRQFPLWHTLVIGLLATGGFGDIPKHLTLAARYSPARG